MVLLVAFFCLMCCRMFFFEKKDVCLGVCVLAWARVCVLLLLVMMFGCCSCSMVSFVVIIFFVGVVLGLFCLFGL